MTATARQSAEELVGAGDPATGSVFGSEHRVLDPSILLEPQRSNMVAPVLVLVVLIAAIMLPEEMSFYLGTLRLTVARTMLLILAPALLTRHVAALFAADCKFVPSDILVLVAGAWMLLAVTIIQGFEKAATSAGVLALEFVMTYVATRALVRRDEDVLTALNAYCLATSVVAVLALLDPLYGSFVVHNWFGTLTDYVRTAQADYRMGLLRAAGTLEHPILLGTHCALSILLSAAIRPRYRLMVRICCLLGLVFSFSSGPLGGLLIGLSMMAYNHLFRIVGGRWILFAAAVIGGVLLLMVVSHNPLGFILSNFTFDPQSAYFRLLIWHYGSEAVMRSPVFGIGLDTDWYREDWMPKSVDSFWLMSAMSFGIPGSILLGATWIAPFLFPRARSAIDRDELDWVAALRTTLNITMVVIVYIGLSVHFWGATWMLISILVGLRACLGSQQTMVPAT